MANCSRKTDEPERASSKALELSRPVVEKQEVVKNNVKVINIGPSKEAPRTEERSFEAPSAPLPSDAGFNDALTSRLKEKMKEAFAGRESAMPDVDIYTSATSLESFSRYYEERGYKIQRTSIPASQIIAPLLDEKPELRDKISLGNYAGITINQIIVEGINVSAADKYIDPETYEVVYKTFVTVTRTR